jgi:hypothetical protein
VKPGKSLHHKATTICRLTLYISGIFLFNISPVLCQTLIGGDLNRIHFDPRLNPYIVEKNLTLSHGRKAKIPAGCVFQFKPFTSIIINGNLEVAGTTALPVFLTSINDQRFAQTYSVAPTPFDWNGISVSEQGTIKLSYTHIQFAINGLNAPRSAVMLNRCQFSHNGRFHVALSGEVFPIKDNEPVSFGMATETKINAALLPKSTDRSSPSKKKALTGPVAKDRKHVRIGCTALGIGSAAIATGYAIKAKRNAAKQDSWLVSQNPSGEDSWLNLDRSRRNSSVASTIGFIFSSISFLGAGLTFVF